MAQLLDADVSVDFSSVTQPHDVVSIIATQPLTSDEHWQQIKPGNYCVFIDGECINM